jgi:hypothetical protein
MCTCESSERAKLMADGYSEQNGGATFSVVEVEEVKR